MSNKVLLLIIFAMLLGVLVTFHGTDIQSAIEQWITGVLGGILALIVPDRKEPAQTQRITTVESSEVSLDK